MTITTKAALADELGVTRSRVSQYVKAGLPVRSDGKLNRDEALNWLRLNQTGLHSEDRGATRAARLARKPQRPAIVEQPDPLLVVIAELVARSGRLAAEVAVEAGAGMQVAYVLDQAVAVHLWNEAERLLGFPVGGATFFEMMVDSRIVEPDWAALADKAGELVNLEAWDEVVSALPSLQPPSTLAA